MNTESEVPEDEDALLSSDLNTLNMLILTKVAQIKAQRMEIDTINKEFQ